MTNLTDRVMGNRQSFSLEQRLFHLHCFIASIFCSCSIITDRFSSLDISSNAMAMMGLIFGLSYLISRYSRNLATTKKVIFVQILILSFIIPIAWFVSGGIIGAISLFALWLIQYFTIVIDRKYLALLIYFIVIFSGFTLELLFPGTIIPSDLKHRVYLYFALIFVSLTLFFHIYFLIYEYRWEHRQLEIKNQELEISERLLAKSQEIAKLGTWELSLPDHKITWSAETYRIFDRDPALDPPSFEEFKTFFHPEDWNKLAPLIDRAITQGIPYTTKKRILLSDGTTKTLLAKAEITKNNQGQTIKLFGIVQDITEQEAIERQLRYSQEILDVAQRIAKVGYWEYKPETDRIEWSEQTFCIMGFEPAPKTPSLSEIQQRIHPEDKKRHTKALTLAIRQGIPYKIELRLLFPDNSIHYIEATSELERQDNKVVRVYGSVLDITDRKQVEQQLNTTLEELRAFKRAIDQSAIVAITDNKGVITHINERFCQISEFSPSELIGHTHRIINSGYHSKEFFTQLWQTIGKGNIWRGEICNRSKSGKLYWLDTVIVPYEDKKNYLAIRFDITDRKLAELKLQESEAKLRSFLDNSSAAIYIKDLEGNYQWVNRNFEQVLQITKDEVINKKDEDFVSPDEVKELRKNDNLAINQGRAITLEESLVLADGQLHSYYCTKFPLFNSSGQIYALAGISIDITDRKQMENALKESEARFRNLANNIPGVILRYILRPDGTNALLYISPGCFDLFSVTQAEALSDVGKLWERCLPEDVPTMRQSILASAQDLTIWQCDYRIRTIDGKLKWLNGIGVPQKQEDGSVIWDTIITEVTDRKRSQAELEALIKERTATLTATQKSLEEQLQREKTLFSVIEAKLREKDTLLKEIHHRVKNNLQIIISLMRLQLDSHQDPALRNSFQDSQNRIQTMALIHERLYRSDNLSEINTAIYLKELTDYLAQTYNLYGKKITVILHTPSLSLDMDKAIPCGLIVNELFTNSIKYAFVDDQGGTVTVSFWEQDAHYHLQVSDTGVGLPPDFDIKRSPSLGLRLVDRLVKQLRGSLTINYDGGTVFSILFPIKL